MKCESGSDDEGRACSSRVGFLLVDERSGNRTQQQSEGKPNSGNMHADRLELLETYDKRMQEEYENEDNAPRVTRVSVDRAQAPWARSCFGR